MRAIFGMASSVAVAVAMAMAMAFATPARADGVVVARATDQRDGGGPCGHSYAVGWQVFDLVAVISGDSPGATFVAIHGCPDWRRLRGELRLVLRTTPPAGQPNPSGKPPPSGLAKFHAASATPENPPETRRVARWLGTSRAEVEAAIKPTATADAWVAYGANVALRYAGDAVIAVRARVALGMTCEDAAEWLGYKVGGGRGFPIRRGDRCDWPGTSDKHRLASGVAGTLRYADGWFEVWRRG